MAQSLKKINLFACKSIEAHQMNIKKVIQRSSRYGVIGLSSALVHSSILFLSSKFIPLWISNLSGFLIASITSYLGHALFTFRAETSGKRFAKRWLLIQFILNVTLSIILPIILEAWLNYKVKFLVLVFTPTAVNAIIWVKAASYSKKRLEVFDANPQLHADDLGLTNTTDKTIIDLAKSGILDGSSLLVNGTNAENAAKQWLGNTTLPLYLHISLTEGRSIATRDKIAYLINKKGNLNASYTNLLIASFLPNISFRRMELKKQIYIELNEQINHFKRITGLESISIDGHQHVHLIPIVLDVIIELAQKQNITWVRTTLEPLPAGLSWQDWSRTFSNNGWSKWIILQLLSIRAKQKLIRASIKTNAGFAGVLFTGHMNEKILLKSIAEMCIIFNANGETRPIILTHPSEPIDLKTERKALIDFPFSKDFFASPLRKMELDSLKKINKK